MRYIFTFLLTLTFLLSYAQDAERTILIKGTVTDEQREPLIGVLVYIKGTPVSNGVMGDIDGNYEIRIKESDVLVFSYLGFQKKEIKYTGKTTIDVLLEEEKNTFCDHPIIYYTERELKANLSASTVTRIVEDIDRRAAGFNSELYINGIVPGIYMQNTDNVFQSQTGIRSGIGNIGGEVRQVVDGVIDAPYNFSDILTFEVVKGAASEINYSSATAPGGLLNITLNPVSVYDLPPKITFNAWAGVQKAIALFPYNNKKMFGNYLDDAFVQHYDVKFNAKENNVSFSGFVGYDGIKGTIKGNDAKQFTPRLNIGYSKKNVSFSQTVYYDYQEQEHSWLYYYYYSPPILGSIIPSIRKDLALIKDNPYKELFSASKLYYGPTNWLRAQTVFSYDWVDTKGGRANNNIYYNSYRDYYDLRNQDNSQNNRWIWDTSVSGRNIFDYFGYTTGFNREFIRLKTFLLSDAEVYKPKWNRSKAVSTLFAKADYNYGYGERTATVGLKQVSSSILGKNSKTVYLPTASASWIFSEESFFNSHRLISSAKVKAGWGKTANTGLYIPIANIYGRNGYPDIDFQDLKWQITSEYDGGISLRFFNDKLYANAEYYHKTTNHIFTNKYLNSQVVQIASGDAKIINKGWNFDLSYYDALYIKNSNYLRWSANANFSINQSSIKNNEDSESLLIQNYIAPKYLYGGGGEISYRNVNLSFKVAGVSDLYLQAYASSDPFYDHLIKVNYISLKSLHLAYSKNKFLGYNNNVTVYTHIENLLFKTNSAVQEYQNANFVQYPVNRTFSLGIKLTFK